MEGRGERRSQHALPVDNSSLRGVADIGSLDRHRPLLLTQAVRAQHVLASNPLCDPMVIPVQRGKGTRESPRDVIYSCFQGSFKRTFCFSLAKMYQPRSLRVHFFLLYTIPTLLAATMVTDSRSVGPRTCKNLREKSRATLEEIFRSGRARNDEA